MAHRQGFEKLTDIETCILEPNGAFFIKAKEPPRHDVRHRELVDRLDAMARQVAEMRRLLAQEEESRGD